MALRPAASSYRATNRHNRPFGLFLTAVVVLAGVLPAQLTTGVIEGTIRSTDDHPLSDSAILITGAAGSRTIIHTNSYGEFAIALPYGRYQLGADGHSSGTTVFVSPLQTLHVALVIDAGGAIQDLKQTSAVVSGLWQDAPRRGTYADAFSLSGGLLSREPSSVTEPLNFTGLSDQRLAVESQRAFSWTGTQYKIQGLDATDSYQPGRPAILPDVQALEEIVVRSAFAQTTSSSGGTEIGVFLAEPQSSWHGAISSAYTGSTLSSANLPPPALRGLVQQSNQFRWFTRDHVEIGGPLTKWADLFASASGQWASQTEPLEASGTDQRSRLLFGNVRGRVRASDKDHIDGFFSGSRINLSDDGVPAGLEALTGNRMAPFFVLPGGFPGQREVDHLDFVQAGWTRHLPAGSGMGAIEVRYGYSVAHLDTSIGPFGESRVELLGGVTGAPPLGNLAIRTRHQVEGTWQPGVLRAWRTRHLLVLGGGWKTSEARNRFTTPSDRNLITANGAPAFVVEFNTPLDTREVVRSFSSIFADHVNITRALSVDLGILADFSRGSLPAQSSPAGASVPARIFGAQSDLIAWNSASPRAAFAWRVPHAHDLVLRGAYFRLYAPLAGRYLDFGNPNSLGGNEYQWIDRNLDGSFQPGEQGALILRFGGPYSSISRSLRRPYSDEFDLAAEFPFPRRIVGSLHLFRRDDKDRVAGIDTGVPPSAFTARTILDPGPDGIPGTFDDQPLSVYEQNPATFGRDQYLLTNPPGLRMLNTGLLAEVRVQWEHLAMHASFVAEKSYGPTNPGNAVFENDPGVLGSLFLDPNTSIHAAGRIFTDRAYVGKIQATYRLPSFLGGIELASFATYMDGLVFARELLVTGFAQGPFLVAATVRGSPEGGNRAEYVIDWNLRLRRDFRVPRGRLAAAIDFLNLTNAGQKIQENDLTGPAFNLRLPVAIQESRCVRFELRYEF